MEESSGLQCEEIKGVPGKNKSGRQFKSPEQLQGLEDFYIEHKYPTESLKAEIAVTLNLTEKQVSGWFCHRRLKDKRLLEELQAPRKQDNLSSGVIQDRASGLKQDSCSSTKQADHKRADLREVESRRFCHENFPAAELNHHQRNLGDGTQVDDNHDTSSESNSARHESFYRQWSNTATENRTLNGFSQPSRGRVGPSGYLKIKGQTENAAITAVKRQLGRHYREDGPSLGIEFDPLPPEAFDSPTKNVNDYAYGVAEPVSFVPHDMSGFHKHPKLSPVRNEKLYETPCDTYLHKSDPNKFTFRKPKQKLAFLNNHGFPGQKTSFGPDSYSAIENSDYNTSRNLSVQRKQDFPRMRSDSQFDYPPHSYGGNNVTNLSNPMGDFVPGYDTMNPKVVRQRERFPSKPVRYKDAMPFDTTTKNGEVYAARGPTSKHSDTTRLKMHPTNELKVNKRVREEVLEEDYPIRKIPQDAALWSKPIKGNAIKFQRG